jgi:hypothetical protein
MGGLKAPRVVYRSADVSGCACQDQILLILDRVVLHDGDILRHFEQRMPSIRSPVNSG